MLQHCHNTHFSREIDKAILCMHLSQLRIMSTLTPHTGSGRLSVQLQKDIDSRGPPYASKVWLTSRSRPSILLHPGLMVPPYTMMDGLLNLAMARMTPGMFLSHPGREMLASYHWPHITVSMLSAMMSREGRLWLRGQAHWLRGAASKETGVDCTQEGCSSENENRLRYLCSGVVYAGGGGQVCVPLGTKGPESFERNTAMPCNAD